MVYENIIRRDIQRLENSIKEICALADTEPKIKASLICEINVELNRLRTKLLKFSWV